MVSGYSITFAALLLIAGSCPTLGAETPASPGKELSFFQQLELMADGRPVPLIAVSIGRGLSQRKPALPLAGKPLKDALQDIGDAYTQPERPEAPKAYQPEIEGRREVYIPFQFDHVWTVARDRQWVVNVDPAIPDPLTTIEPRKLVQQQVTSLTEDQCRRAGTPGLRLSDLSRGQRDVFRAAFRGTFALEHMLPPDPGSYEPKSVTDFDGVLPIEECVLHVYTAWSDVTVWEEAKPGQQRGGQSYPFLPYEGRMVFPHNEGAAQGYRVPAVIGAPAKLKPSDLDFGAPALAAPIGLSGITRVDRVIEAAARLSRMSLKVDPRYGSHEVYVGDASLPAGEVLRAIAFDIQGGWRKVGGTYLLTFDRIGLAAMQTYLDERLSAADRRTQAVMSQLLNRDIDETAWAVRSLPLLGPDPDGPPAPMAE